MAAVQPMKFRDNRKAQVTHPTGDPKFAVMQAFPSGYSAEEADPFLMCDEFGPTASKGKAKHADEFDVGWHPHRGMDILTYMVSGVGRHADSMGNRCEFASPGMQWISVGSGIEHAEGGGTPAGEVMHGFQIWLNVPTAKKMDDPRYGTEPPENIPVISLGTQATARLLAGTVGDVTGPFTTVQPVQMLDIEMAAGASAVHAVPIELNTCLVYVFQGSVEICGGNTNAQHVARLDAADASKRGLSLVAGGDGARMLVFSGKRLNETIAWRGPFVLGSDDALRQTMFEYQRGKFPPKRVDWDYRKASAMPK